MIRSRRSCYVRCFEENLRPCPSLSDRVVIRFVIADGSGAVRSAEVESHNGVPRETAMCLAEEVRALEFPAPACGDIKVAYPFQVGSTL